MQNTAARIVSRMYKFGHISPELHDLHWLPVKSRGEYKLLCITYAYLYGESPEKLEELIPRYILVFHQDT